MPEVRLDGETVVHVATDAQRELAAVVRLDWRQKVPGLEWSCRDVLAHLVGVLAYYAELAAPGRAETEATHPDMTIAELVQQLGTNAGHLARRIASLPDDARVEHVAGCADRDGVAAMACDELLVHVHDLARPLGFPWEPDAELCAAVLARLFPWTTPNQNPWPQLLHENGRPTAAGPSPVGDAWVWHCAPIAEWDGAVPRWDPVTRRVVRAPKR